MAHRRGRSHLIRKIQAETERETTFVITADHGENLVYEAEDRLFGHKSSLSEALLHVLLSIVNPPEGMYDAEEHRYFSHLNLGDLIVGLANEERADVFRKSVPAELIGSEMEDVGQIASEEEFEFHSRSQRCAIAGEQKFLWDSRGGTAEYRLDHGRPNWQELAAEEVTLPERAQEHFSIGLREYRMSSDGAKVQSGREEVDDHTKDRLKELGYL